MSHSVSRPKRFLVTGGRGRLAALIADYFSAPGHEVSLYSRQGGAGFQELAALCSPGHLAGSDSLLHLAWSSLPATSEQSPGIEAQHDLPLLEKLLAALAALPSAGRPHFVFFSSGGAIYGNAPGRPSREDDACQPIGRYGAAKLAAEQLINAAAARHGLPCAILRIANPYGYPVPTGRAQGIIPHAIRAAAEGRPLTLWGDGHARKDFLYYTDFLSALREITDRRLTGTFNLCAGESHSVHEIIALVEKHTGRKVATATTPAPAWDVQDSRLDPARLTAATGWRPQVTLDEGVRRAAAGFLDHP
jgi:UDP-glucose 4-epimerase